MQNFDPYHVWLGIPPNEQPPHHYRLLGLQLFEAIPDVIESAADRQMKHLRTFQTGPHGVDSQRLLGEVAAANICLLNPARKQEYDQQLRTNLAPPPAAPTPTPVPAVSIAPAVHAVLPQQFHALPTAAPISFVAPAAGPSIMTTSQPVTPVRGRSKKSSPLAALGVCGVSIAALVVAVVWFKANQPDPLAARPPKPSAKPTKPVQSPPLGKLPGSRPLIDPAKSPDQNTLAAKPVPEPARPAIPPENALIVPAAGEQRSAAWEAELLRNGGCEEPRIAGSIPGWTTFRGSWSAQPANRDTRIVEGKHCFYAGNTSLGQLYQDVDIGSLAVGIDSGRARVRFSAQTFSFNQKPPDTWQVRIEFRGVNAFILDSHDTGEKSSPGRWSTLEIERLVPMTTRSIRVTLFSRRHGANTKSNDAKFDALSLRLFYSQSLLPIPGDEALAAVREKIDAEHADEIKAAKSQPQKRALSQVLLSRALAEKADMLLRYALLRRTLDVANDGGAYDVATKAIDALHSQFDVDHMALRETALDYADRLAKSKTEKRMAATSWRELARLAAAQDNYDAALRASQKAASVAREADDKALLKTMVDALNEVKQIKASK